MAELPESPKGDEGVTKPPLRYEETAGPVLVQLLKDQLDAEQTRKQSLEQRGITVITTSGALVTLVLALAALVPSTTGSAVPAAARVAILIALALFAAASLMGLLVNWPFAYIGLDAHSMKALLSREHWAAPQSAAARSIAELLREQLEGAQKAHRLKARLLILAIAAEVSAVAAIVASIFARLMIG